MKERTEERILVAQAKASYWKRYRDNEGSQDKGRFEEEWKKVKEGVLALEERGGWIDEKIKDIGHGVEAEGILDADEEVHLVEDGVYDSAGVGGLQDEICVGIQQGDGVQHGDGGCTGRIYTRWC